MINIFKFSEVNLVFVVPKYGAGSNCAKYVEEQWCGDANNKD